MNNFLAGKKNFPAPVSRLSIETGAGDFFISARKLFKNCGFETCDPFAQYKEDINSVYMSLLIGNKS